MQERADECSAGVFAQIANGDVRPHRRPFPVPPRDGSETTGLARVINERNNGEIGNCFVTVRISCDSIRPVVDSPCRKTAKRRTNSHEAKADRAIPMKAK